MQSVSEANVGSIGITVAMRCIKEVTVVMLGAIWGDSLGGRGALMQIDGGQMGVAEGFAAVALDHG